MFLKFNGNELKIEAFFPIPAPRAFPYETMRNLTLSVALFFIYLFIYLF